MTVEELLPAYLARQRWFPGRRPERVRILDQEDVEDGLRWMIVEADGARYQLVFGSRPAERAPDFLQDQHHAVLGVVDDSLVFDAVVDPRLALALLRKVDPDEEAAHVRPMAAEQSHTSLVFDDRLVLKIFRRLREGPNPDIEITRALAEVGFGHVAAPLATWTLEESHLAVVQPYLAGGTEGSSLAMTSLRDFYDEACEDPAECGGDFAGEARRLGEVSAQMHLALARALGSQPGDSSAWASTAEAQLARLDEQDADVAAVRELVHELRSVRDSGTTIRVHGDYHLGQVLRTDEGWFVLDFEGEPARPAGERQAWSSPLKDVAGMVRSMDYATELALDERDEGERETLGPLGAAWSARNRGAFMDGYYATEGIADLLPAGRDERLAVLKGFELDKAVYEVLYEREYRPDWVEIPRRAIRRLLNG